MLSSGAARSSHAPPKSPKRQASQACSGGTRELTKQNCGAARCSHAPPIAPQRRRVASSVERATTEAHAQSGVCLRGRPASRTSAAPWRMPTLGRSTGAEFDSRGAPRSGTPHGSRDPRHARVSACATVPRAGADGTERALEARSRSVLVARALLVLDATRARFPRPPIPNRAHFPQARLQVSAWGNGRFARRNAKSAILGSPA